MSEPEVVAQTVMAQRLWRWTPDYGLEGMRKVWTSGFMEADCHRGHESPFWNPDGHNSYFEWPHTSNTNELLTSEPPCLCGVNAYKLTHLFDPGDLRWAQGMEYQNIFQPTQVDALPVLGIVELGGNVHEYEYGYRAQYARITEGTVLTSLPIDSRLLTDLEDRYEAPFRVQAYDEWKEEWEATYGRDRETEETDQGSETGEETGPSYATGGAVQSTGHLTVSFNTTAFTQAVQQARQATHHTVTQAYLLESPTRWERFRDWWVCHGPFLLMSVGAAVMFVSIVALLVESL